MVKKPLKNIGMFLVLLLLSVLILIVFSIPKLLLTSVSSSGTEGDSNPEIIPLFLFVLLGLSAFVITFMLCAKMITDAKTMLKKSKHQPFIEIDRSKKGCTTVIYGYNVPIATINAYYAPNGEIAELIKKEGIISILDRHQQLACRLAFLGDLINCIAALTLSMVTAYITSIEILSLSSFNVIISVVIIGVTVATVFLRPVLAERNHPMNDGITKYELQKIEQVLFEYNQNLNLRNMESPKNMDKLLEIRKLQKELDMEESRKKQKKLRKKINVLENGCDSPDKKERTNTKKASMLYEKYKPSSWFYILIIVMCIIVRFIPLSTGSEAVDNAINDFAIGAAASTWAALLLALLDCRQKNKALAEKKKMVFAWYSDAISDLRIYAADRCKKFCQEEDKNTFREWLEKLSDAANYPKASSPAVTMNRVYFHISSYVKNIKSALLALREQYCVLVDSDIVDTDDLRQHITLQINRCNEICDNLEIGNYELQAILIANETLVELESAFRLFLGSTLEERYSYRRKG